MSARWWFLTWTTYGTWLPGDARGFVSTVEDGPGPRVRHNTPGTDYDTGDEGLQEAARRNLKQPPVWLRPEQAVLLADQFHETARYRGWELLDFSIMPNHVHLVTGVPDDPDPTFILGSYKEYASRCLNRHRGAKQEWWTESGSKRRAYPPLHRVVRYVRDQHKPLFVWIAPEWQAELERLDREDPLGERGA